MVGLHLVFKKLSLQNLLTVLVSNLFFLYLNELFKVEANPLLALAFFSSGKI